MRTFFKRSTYIWSVGWKSEGTMDAESENRWIKLNSASSKTNNLGYNIVGEFVWASHLRTLSINRDIENERLSP